MSQNFAQKLVDQISIASVALTAFWLVYDICTEDNIFDSASALLAAIVGLLVRVPIKAKLATPSGHDIELFDRFSIAFPFEPTVRLLRDLDFGGSFPRRSIQPLLDFVESWDSVENEFVDNVLELERKTLYEVANRFALELVKRTVPVGDGTNVSVVSDNFRAAGRPRTPYILEDARVLNAEARMVVSAYERFVRRCRETLKR